MSKHLKVLISIICILSLSGCSFQASYAPGGADERAAEMTSVNDGSVQGASNMGGQTADISGNSAASTQAASVEVASAEASLASSPKEDSTTLQKEQSSDVTLLMVGDILLHEPVQRVAKDAEGNYNYDFIFEHVKPKMQAADVAIVNQEVIIGGKELGVSGYPMFNAPYEAGDALVAAGVDVVCHATNHSLDMGKKGIINCYEFWKQRYPQIKVVGLNGFEYEYENIDIIEKNGIKIAILNYSYGTNGIAFPKDMPHAVDMLEKAKVEKDLKYAEENADFTLVIPHWGTEYNLGTDAYQEYWTGIFREGGADLVIGAHPHVIEPVEMIEDENTGITNNHGGGDMLVYYSLGNFVSWTSSTGKGVSNRSVGGMAKVTITKNASGEAVIKDHEVEAVVCHESSKEHGVTVYPLSEYSEDLAKENEIKLQDSSFTMQYCVDLCDKVWGHDWK